MSKKIILFSLVFLCTANSLILGKAGKHTGERKMLAADISFFNTSGKTVTNSKGVFYHYYGIVVHENKVYPSKYWGEYPLFFIGNSAGIKVTVSNKGPRAKIKLRVKTECYTLKTDGSNGMTLMAPRTVDFVVNRGETKTIDASFAIQNQPGMESGLDRFIVKLLHINEGSGPGNNEPALIMQKEGVFCPPE